MECPRLSDDLANNAQGAVIAAPVLLDEGQDLLPLVLLAGAGDDLRWQAVSIGMSLSFLEMCWAKSGISVVER